MTMELVQNTINNLSKLIAELIRSKHGEEIQPNSSPDNSDDFIKDCKAKIELLRRVRNELEDALIY